ncbi:hypothetical protein B1A99_21935 [Cohnella sp. CIP 111063]|uniref:hypothetical protein n=1 Tax=unclassified Cohnella TaxID=2636738 RepID=UPI000B8C412C|nr:MULTISPECIES: hypothetical protein [unclassified Cohnella]OXS55889.1 hypothetical protein B1A99_21935 [Cohnella sp. CIP 111063]PRX67091.1 hypothetical protein B0G52_115101 [Cohnella sp. SGD-V74]
MDQLIEEILLETKRLGNEEIASDYEQFEALVERRQELTELVEERRAELTVTQKAIIRELLTYDSLILAKMNRLKDEAESSIRRMNETKKQQAAYNHAGVYDSFLMDKKK